VKKQCNLPEIVCYLDLVKVKNLMGHNGEVLACAFTTDTKYVISSSHDKTVRIWDVESGSCVHVLEGQSDIFNVNVLDGHSSYVRCIALSHDIKNFNSRFEV